MTKPTERKDRLMRDLPAGYRLAAAVTVLSVAIMLMGRMWWRPFTAPATLAASLGFVAAALGAGGLKTGYGRLVVSGLVLCAIGDLVGPRDFHLGMYAFFLGHVLFIPAFLLRAARQPASRRRVATAACAVFAITAAVTFAWLHPHLPAADRPAVLAYIAVLALMVIGASAVQTTSFGPRAAVWGAVLFYLSDIFIANWRYVITDSWNAFAAYPLYYLACLCLAASVIESCDRRRRA